MEYLPLARNEDAKCRTVRSCEVEIYTTEPLFNDNAGENAYFVR